MKIIIDTREKNTHALWLIKNWLERNGYSYEVRQLDFGDYSFEFNGKSYEKEIVIERKSGDKLIGGGFSELKENLFENKSKVSKRTAENRKKGIHLSDNKRISLELYKALISKSEFVLMLENVSCDDDINLCPVHGLMDKRKFIGNSQYVLILKNWLVLQNKLRFEAGLSQIKIFYSCNFAEDMINIFKNYMRNEI